MFKELVIYFGKIVLTAITLGGFMLVLGLISLIGE